MLELLKVLGLLILTTVMGFILLSTLVVALAMCVYIFTGYDFIIEDIRPLFQK